MPNVDITAPAEADREEFNLALGLNSGRLVLPSFTAIAATTIPSEVTKIETLGYATEGDGGGGVYDRRADDPGHAAAAQSVDTAWWGLSGATPNIRQFGAVLDGMTDDLAAFAAADAYGVYPIIVDGPAYLSTAPNPRWGQYLLVGPTASVDQNGSSFLPAYKDEPVEGGGRYIVRALIASQDPSPVITGAEYPMPAEAHSVFYQTYNWWGAQGADINDAALGRTGMYQTRWQLSHLGEGDAYNWIGGGTVTPHGRIGDATSTKGQSNGGIGGGQWNAGGNQVTLYGIGDIVLSDQGYDSVAIRGLVLHLDREGDDDAYGYRADSFGLRIYSREAGDIGNAINIQGNFEVGLSLTRAECSSDIMISLGEGQKISFDDSAATPGNSYNPETFGAYWIQKTGSDALELAANGGAVAIAASTLTYTPVTPGAYTLRVGGTGTVSAAVGATGNVVYFSAFSSGADNTTMSLRTAQSGTESDKVTIAPNGTVNLVNGPLQIGSTQVLNGRKTGWTAPTGTATRTGFATSTVTLEVLAEHVMAMIVDEMDQGLKGA